MILSRSEASGIRAVRALDMFDPDNLGVKVPRRTPGWSGLRRSRAWTPCGSLITRSTFSVRFWIHRQPSRFLMARRAV